MQPSNSLSAVHPRRLHARNVSAQASTSSLPDPSALGSLSTSNSFQSSLSSSTSGMKRDGSFKSRGPRHMDPFWSSQPPEKWTLSRLMRGPGNSTTKLLGYIRMWLLVYGIVSLFMFTRSLLKGNAFSKAQPDINSGRSPCFRHSSWVLNFFPQRSRETSGESYPEHSQRHLYRLKYQPQVSFPHYFAALFSDRWTLQETFPWTTLSQPRT